MELKDLLIGKISLIIKRNNFDIILQNEDFKIENLKRIYEELALLDDMQGGYKV